MFIQFTRITLVFSALLLCNFGVNGAQFYNDWAATRFVDIPSQSGPFADPDQDGQANLVEFAFGTDPRVTDDFHGLIIPRFADTNGGVGVEVWQRLGHQLGAQINLAVSADLVHWTWPWWQRAPTNSLPSDSPGSIRELFTTFLA